MSPSQSTQKPLSTPLWWVCFAAATYVMSLCFQTFKVFTLAPNWTTGLGFLGVCMLLVFITGTLVFDSYVKERRLGKVQRPAALFERLAQKLHLTLPALEDGSP